MTGSWLEIAQADLADGFANNGCGRLTTTLDAEDRERAEWPGQRPPEADGPSRDSD
jgi:hypothetical protein